MLRKLLLIGVGVLIGYVIGAQAGFHAAVRDYLDNDAGLIERVAENSDSFTFPVDSGDGSGSSSHERTYQ